MRATVGNFAPRHPVLRPEVYIQSQILVLIVIEEVVIISDTAYIRTLILRDKQPQEEFSCQFDQSDYSHVSHLRS